MNALRCPDEAAWSKFLSDASNDSHELDLSRHLQSCQECRQLLERMTAHTKPSEMPDTASEEQLSTLKLRVLRRMETPHAADSCNDTRALEPNRPPRELPERIGRFQVVRLLGEGGFGLILLAYDPLLRRQVALKLPRATLIADSQQEQRFLREARAAGGLSHPQIVPVYEVGREGDQYFFSMGYVEGESLSARLDREGPLPPRQAAKMIEQIAEAVEYAHQHGIVHRDLKPQNVLLATDGQPCVTDFGLAKQLSESDMLTVSGQVMGTPSFMSPEQAQGRLAEVGPQSDVYALGAMLYHMLAGRPPFAGDNVLEVLKQVTETEPISLRKVDPHIPRDLQTIAMKCLDKSPRRRYPTAGELAAELRRFQDGEAILARPITRVERTWRWIRKRPAAAVLATLLIVAVLFAYYRERSLQRDMALGNAENAAWGWNWDEFDLEIIRAEALGAPTWRILMLRGLAAYFRGDYGSAIEWLEEAVAIQPNHVAAQSLLAAAYVATGKWEQYEATMQQVDSLVPKNEQDYLFKGLAKSYLDPQGSLLLLNQAVKLRKSELARLIRAEVYCNLARDTADPQDAAAAVEDADVVLKLLDSPAALLASLNANLVASGIYEASDERRKDAEQQARESADRLKLFAHLPLVAVDLANYLQVTGRDSEAIAVLRAAAGQPLVDYNLALALYRAGHADEAFNLLDGEDNVTDNARWLRVWLSMEHLKDGDHQPVLDVYETLKEREASGLEVLFRPCVVLLLGEREQAIDESRTLRTQPNVIPKFRATFYKQLLDFNCDTSDASELLDVAGKSMWDRCEANFFIALHDLAEGNRTDARLHFQAALDTRCYGMLAWDWSAVALERLDAEPTWPAWIKLQR